jgi:hypothetical protein
MSDSTFSFFQFETPVCKEPIFAEDQIISGRTIQRLSRPISGGYSVQWKDSNGNPDHIFQAAGGRSWF